MVDTVSIVIKTGQSECIEIIGQYLQFTNQATRSTLGNMKPDLFHMAQGCEGSVQVRALNF